MRYATLFRGINVGGKNAVKMEALQELLRGLVFGKVKTYIQSGNAVFETALEKAALSGMIASAFGRQFGFESGVLIRSAEEFWLLTERLPMEEWEVAEAEAADPRAAHLYVYFLEHPPAKAWLEKILQGYEGVDLLRAGEKELYVLCRGSIRESRLAVRVSKAFPHATARNWKTVRKLVRCWKACEVY